MIWMLIGAKEFMIVQKNKECRVGYVFFYFDQSLAEV